MRRWLALMRRSRRSTQATYAFIIICLLCWSTLCVIDESIGAGGGWRLVLFMTVCCCVKTAVSSVVVVTRRLICGRWPARGQGVADQIRQLSVPKPTIHSPYKNANTFFSFSWVCFFDGVEFHFCYFVFSVLVSFFFLLFVFELTLTRSSDAYGSWWSVSYLQLLLVHKSVCLFVNSRTRNAASRSTFRL